MRQFEFVNADDAELNQLLAGRRAGSATRWLPDRAPPRLGHSNVGVVYEQPDEEEVLHPFLLVVKSEDQRRLFGRFANLRSDLSPISSWCHVIDSRYAERLGPLERVPYFRGLEAAWTGVCIAEALIRAARPLSALKLGACQATQSFVVARACGIWGATAATEAADKFVEAYRLLRVGGGTGSRDLHTTLQPIWLILSACTDNVRSTDYRPQRLVDAVNSLIEARRRRLVDEFSRFVEPLRDLVPELTTVPELTELAADQRLRIFDRMLALIQTPSHEGVIKERLIALSMVAGYIATVAAGGAPSISLAENSKLPEVLAWAYALGGVGERVFWTSSFDGLGRLVARELTRNFCMTEPPTCDFSLDEARVLVDPALKDSLVALRIKQARSVAVSLLPGVNLSVPLTENASTEKQEQDKISKLLPTDSESTVLPALARALWPYIESMLNAQHSQGRQSYVPAGGRNKSKKRPDQTIPPKQDTFLGKK